jgi:hypothetical protein
MVGFFDSCPTEKVIAEHAYALVPSGNFDELLASLDQPPEGTAKCSADQHLPQRS